MKKVTRLSTIILMLFVILFSVHLSALDSQKETSFQSSARTIGVLNNCNSYYYKNTLTDAKEIALYEEIESALFYRIDNYKIYFSDKDTIDKIALYVCLDNPFFTITDSFYTNEGNDTQNSFVERLRAETIPFVFNDDQYYDKMISAYQKATEIISDMPEYDDEYDKIKYLHDYIVMNVRYTYDAADKDADTAYGALLNGKARCEGYTNAFSILLNLAHIENAKVFYFGDDEIAGHIWNLVKINGSYYHADTTNDSFNTDDDIPSNYISYAYFLVSTDDIKKTSPINDKIESVIPACDSTQDNFYYKNGLYFNAYDRLKIGKAAGFFLSEQNDEDKAGVSIKFKNAADYNKALSSLEIDYLINTIVDYSDADYYYYIPYKNDKQQVITFFLQ